MLCAYIVMLVMQFPIVMEECKSRVSLARPNEPDPPLTRIFDPEGQPDPPLLTTLRNQPDSTRFLTLGVGFNPIQPVNPKQKIPSFFAYFLASRYIIGQKV